MVRDDYIRLREIAHRIWIDAGRPAMTRQELFRLAEKVLFHEGESPLVGTDDAIRLPRQQSGK
jgi:hypothetical protein